MMKGFLKNGKWIGLLAVGLLFAGCYGGGSSDSSTEAAAPASDQLSQSYFPMTVDPANTTITLGDGTGAAVAGVIGTHPVLLMNDNGVPTCSGAGADVTCWLRVVNQDPDYYMANASFVLTACATCDGLGAQVDNADMINGVTLCELESADPDAGCATSTGVAGVEFCIVEDGDNFNFPYPGNVYGCQTLTTPNAFTAPEEILHPDCGSRKVFVDFSGTDQQYSLLGGVKAQWFKQNPTSGDSRYDFNKFSTFYVMVADLSDNGTYGATYGGPQWLRPGSYRRSEILSGWGATGSATMTTGTQFAVNVAMEYSDTIEKQTMGSVSSIGSGYIYPASFGFVLRYNLEAVTRTDGLMQSDYSSGSPAVPTFDNLYVDGTSSLDNQAAGYISVAVNSATDFFMLGDFGTSMYYANDFQPKFALNNGPAVVGEGRHYGVAHKVMGPNGGPTTYAWAGLTEDQVMVQEGPDAAPDQPLAMFRFTATGAAGVKLGSQFWIETHSTATKMRVGHTLTSLIPSGVVGDMGGPGGDWINFCYTADLGVVEACDGSGPGLDPPAPTDTVWIRSGNEELNKNIGHGGYGKPNQAMQQWHAHICVQ